MKKLLPVFILLAIFFVMVLTSVNTKSPVCDAAGHHIAAAYSYLKTGDFRMNPSSPPLLRLLMGLPLLSLDLKVPTGHPSWKSINSTAFSYQFLFVDNVDSVERIVFLSRLSMVVLSTLLGFLIFIWSKKIYGYRAGLFALFLYIFSPNVLANAGLAMLDIGCAFFVFLALFQLWRYLKEKSLLNLILTGLCFGLAQATKISSIVLYPLFAVFIIYDYSITRKDTRLHWFRPIAALLLIWFIGLSVLWSTYLFEFKPLLQNAPDIEEKIEYIRKIGESLPLIGSSHLADSLIYFAKTVPIPLSAYAISFLGVTNSVILGQQRLVFMGKEVLDGSNIYYIVNYLIKTPIAVIIMLFFSIFLFRRRSKVGILTNLFLMLPVVLIFSAASFSRLQGGLRYILPMYPFLFIWISDIVNFESKKIRLKIIIVLLSCWYLISSLLGYPHYLAYFNESVGGPRGFGYKITTDMDWGQDFKALKRYMDEKGIDEVKLYCFGTVAPEYYGIRYKDLTASEFKEPLPATYYAISSRYLNGLAWTDKYKPLDRVARTIFIYKIEERR